MKLNEIKNQYDDATLLKIAKAVGNKMFGDSHSGLIFDDKVTHMTYSDYIQMDDTDAVGTYDFIFFPSNKTGIDVSDEQFNPSFADKDDKIYIGGSNGVYVLSNPFKMNSKTSTIPDKEFLEFTNSIKKFYPKAKIEKKLNEYNQLFVHFNDKIIGQFIIDGNMVRWLVIDDKSLKTLDKYNWY